MTEREQPKNLNALLAKKILDFQKEVEAIVKDKKNPFHKSNYADINGIIGAIKPILAKTGLCVVQPLELAHFQDNEGKLKTVEIIKCEIIDTDTGFGLTSSMILPPEKNPQDRGKIITYYRRYLLQSALCLQAEDDAGETAAKKFRGEKPAKSKPKSSGGPKKFPGGGPL